MLLAWLRHLSSLLNDHLNPVRVFANLISIRYGGPHNWGTCLVRHRVARHCFVPLCLCSTRWLRVQRSLSSWIMTQLRKTHHFAANRCRKPCFHGDPGCTTPCLFGNSGSTLCLHSGPDTSQRIPAFTHLCISCYSVFGSCYKSSIFSSCSCSWLIVACYCVLLFPFSPL